MVERSTSSEGSDRLDTDGGTDAIYAEIEPNPETAEYDLLELIAQEKGKEIEELPSLYTEVDHFVETLFEDPPSPRAQMEIQFSYAGYRVVVSQAGKVKLLPVADSAGSD